MAFKCTALPSVPEYKLFEDPCKSKTPWSAKSGLDVIGGLTITVPTIPCDAWFPTEQS